MVPAQPYVVITMAFHLPKRCYGGPSFFPSLPLLKITPCGFNEVLAAFIQSIVFEKACLPTAFLLTISSPHSSRLVPVQTSIRAQPSLLKFSSSFPVCSESVLSRHCGSLSPLGPGLASTPQAHQPHPSEPPPPLCFWDPPSSFPPQGLAGPLPSH